MFNPGRMRQPHFYDEILLSLSRQPMQQADAIVTHGVSIEYVNRPVYLIELTILVIGF